MTGGLLLDALPALDFSRIEAYWLFYLTISWGLAWGGYALYRRMYPDRPRWTWDRVVGLAFVLFPFVDFAHDFIESIRFVLDRGSVARTVPAWVWWRAIRRRTWEYVLLPLFGLFLLFGHAHWRRLSLAARLKDTLVRIDAWPRRSWTRDLVNGFGLFVLAWIGYIVFLIATAGLRGLDTGDESAVFLDVTPALAFGLSLIAGVSEEFLFRGILQTAFRRVMPVGFAIALQSLLFGLIHSGYGTLSHIVAPAFFGALMGVVVLRFGLWPAILIHILVDLVIFLATAATNGWGWAAVLIPWVFYAGVALPVAYYGWEWYLRRQREGLDRPGPGGRNA